MILPPVLRGPLKLALDVPAQVFAPAPRRRTLIPWLAAWLLLSAGLYRLSTPSAASTAEKDVSSPPDTATSEPAQAAVTPAQPALATALQPKPNPLDTRALKFEAVKDDSNLKVFAGGAHRLAAARYPERSGAVPDPTPSTDDSAEEP